MRTSESWAATSYEERLDALVEESLAPYREAADVAAAPMSDLALLLARGLFPAECNAAVRGFLGRPGTGPFWMMELTLVTFGGAAHLEAETLAGITASWARVRQLRGDTENHWVLYHATLYLAAHHLGPDAVFENGRSAAENRAEALDWLGHWVHGAVRLGQSEYHPTHYLAEYAVPLLMLVLWAPDADVATSARMVLDVLFAELAALSLAGVLRGPHARTDDLSVVAPWNSMTSLYSWLLFGSTAPQTARNGWWNGALAQLAHGYRPPEVTRRIAVDPAPVREQRDRARSRRMIRGAAEPFREIRLTHYLRPSYAVGSTQGGLSDAIQGHAWDVTWHEEEPQGRGPTFFSAHPHHHGTVLQMYFSCAPEPMAASVPYEGKPSYTAPDSLLGVSAYEQVVQDRDTLVALYAIPADAPNPHVNTFVSKDLRELRESPSGWFFARGGDAWLAFRPLGAQDWAEHRTYPDAWDPTRTEATGSRLLVSRDGYAGTIVQAADAAEFADLDAFAAAVEAAPLEFGLDPVPWVAMTSIRGTTIEARHGRPPLLDGVPPAPHERLGGTHLNSVLGSGVVSIRHGDLERILDFGALTTTDLDHSPTDGPSRPGQADQT